MKIVQVHNYYQISGGEDTVVAAEKKLLEEKGHQVITYYRHNSEIKNQTFTKKLGLLKETNWSDFTYHDFLKVLEKEQPDLCHVHNFLPLISPSIFYACEKANVPVVQTLHNYRLICTNGLLMRQGQICESCLGKSAYQSVLKKCYRDSMIQTYAIASMLEKHKKRQTWTTKIDAFICLTEFARDKFIAHGLPPEKLKIKPNFMGGNSSKEIEKKEENPYFIYVGRLTESKGVNLFKAINADLPFPIKMVGEGELMNELRGLPTIEVLGTKTHDETVALIRNARALILPSLWYEGMPMVILEAFAVKTPVIASNLGAMKSMIQHTNNGLLFSAGSSAELLNLLQMAKDYPDKMKVLADNAFANYAELYSSEANYEKLMEIYQSVIHPA